jgi:hypothetical protein
MTSGLGGHSETVAQLRKPCKGRVDGAASIRSGLPGVHPARADAPLPHARLRPRHPADATSEPVTGAE